MKNLTAIDKSVANSNTAFIKKAKIKNNTKNSLVTSVISKHVRVFACWIFKHAYVSSASCYSLVPWYHFNTKNLSLGIVSFFVELTKLFAFLSLRKNNTSESNYFDMQLFITLLREIYGDRSAFINLHKYLNHENSAKRPIHLVKREEI